MADATPIVPALLLIAFQPDPLATPFPNPLYPVPVNVDLSSLFLTMSTTVGGDGVADFNLPIAGNPVLAGMSFYTQWFIFDPAALATGGVYGSRGVQHTIF